MKQKNLVTEGVTDSDRAAIAMFEKNKKQYFLVPNDDGKKTMERLASNSIRKYIEAVNRVKPLPYKMYSDIKDLYDDILEADYPFILDYTTTVEKILKILDGRQYVFSSGNSVAQQLDINAKELDKIIMNLKKRGLWK